MTVMLKSLDQHRYHSIQTNLLVQDTMSGSGVKKSSNIENLPQISSSPKLSKTRIPRLLREELTPHFTVKRISELKEANGDKRERKKGRKYSDDFELRRRLETVDPSSMKSVSLEKLSNDSGVWYCVRGSQEAATTKKASSVSQPVDRALNQTAKLHRNAAYPRVYKHQSSLNIDQHRHPHKGYAAMHAAKQALKEQQRHPRKVGRRVEKINKQIDDNRIRIGKEARCLDPNSDPLQDNKYPHTLPSAMYPPPHPSEYPGLYEPLPRVLDEPHSVKPLPPITTQCQDHNLNTVSTTRPEPASSPRVSLASPSPTLKNPQGSYAQPERLKITYKPYGIQEYIAMKATFGTKVGGLGPDTDSEEYKEKLARTNRKLEYSERIREKHLQREFPKKKPSKQYVPPSKTVLANEYARTIARPRVTKHRQLMPIERLNSQKPDSTSSQDVIAEKLLMSMHHRKIMSDLGHII